MDERRAPDETTLSPVCRAFLLKLGRTPDKTKRLRIVAACAKVAAALGRGAPVGSPRRPQRGRQGPRRKGAPRPQALHPEWAIRRLLPPPWYARSSALAVIGCRRIREALPAVGRAVDDANVEVRRAAAEALGEIGGEEAVRLLVRLKKDANPYVRAAAEEAIGKTSGVRFS